MVYQPLEIGTLVVLLPGRGPGNQRRPIPLIGRILAHRSSSHYLVACRDWGRGQIKVSAKATVPIPTGATKDQIEMLKHLYGS